MKAAVLLISISTTQRRYRITSLYCTMYHEAKRIEQKVELEKQKRQNLKFKDDSKIEIQLEL